MTTQPEPDGPRDRDEISDAPPADPTAIPSSTPYAGPSAYGTPPEPAFDDPARPYAVGRPPGEGGRGMSKRTLGLIRTLAPFVAVALFFILRSADVDPAWLAFLLIPVTFIVTDHLRGSPHRRD
ncbi:hypothetical protein [Litorihabitans aurantiacus]|uniref:Uncharacterized protein n=1 Tax=Litorihabitans aurantiacus TaxID=1930061 RepID=A0AA37XHK7_9MICO|nr:hypothetical protein [Litorihabitans aurantiacus]GMA33378.1 hypothetical protein GCM10025875_33700 [Litorihabitans aurantiacus]